MTIAGAAAGRESSGASARRRPRCFAWQAWRGSSRPDPMYTRFYGFIEHPFNLTPDPRYLYLTKKHSEALAHLEYALTCRKGVTVLTGEVGTGKTILLRTALGRVRSSPLH